MPFEQQPQAFNPAGRLPVQRQQRRDRRLARRRRSAATGRSRSRARRIQQLLDRPDKHDLDASAAMQMDHLSLAAAGAEAADGVDQTRRRARAAGAGAGRRLGRRDGRRTRRAADRRDLPLRAAQGADHRQDRRRSRRRIRPAARHRDAVAGQGPSRRCCAPDPDCAAALAQRARPRAGAHRRRGRATT